MYSILDCKLPYINNKFPTYMYKPPPPQHPVPQVPQVQYTPINLKTKQYMYIQYTWHFMS